MEKKNDEIHALTNSVYYLNIFNINSIGLKRKKTINNNVALASERQNHAFQSIYILVVDLFQHSSKTGMVQYFEMVLCLAFI